jgi:hypothetical protein
MIVPQPWTVVSAGLLTMIIQLSLSKWSVGIVVADRYVAGVSTYSG